jgi:tetratricopeptide (TPR) repeat protein
LDHNGVMVSGQFERGNRRGGGHWMNAFERDRVRAMQLMAQAMPLTDKVAKEGRDDVGKYYLELSNMLLANRGWGDAWRLQYLTDLTKLADYDEGYYGWYGRGWGNGSGGGGRGAPVDDKGQVIYHQRPKTWAAAATDGERWRWCLTQAEEFGHSQEARFTFADFLHNQFGVQTMGGYGRLFGRQADDSKKNTSGPYELSSLGEDETIARLATGIRRFKLPDEFNYIKIYQQLASEGKDKAAESLDALAGIFEDRQQYPKAADYWKQAIAKFGPGPVNNHYRQNRLDQIVGNWGLFEGTMTQPAGAGATVDFRFRNGAKVSFVANEIDIAKLLADVKAYVKTLPAQLDWERVSIDQIGWQLVQNKRKEYMGKEVAKWDLKLDPRPNHFDWRITVATPLQQPGAYLLTSTMEGGNTCSTVLWVADTAIVKKPLDGKSYYFVADAASGQPLPKVNVEYFGYSQQWKNDADNRNGHLETSTVDFAEFTDPDGQIILDDKRQPQNYQYLIIATTPKDQGGRLAYLGFTGMWYGRGGYDAQYNQTKVFVMTDRPVYRPAQPVKFKFWVNQAQYDREGKSPFAGKSFLVRVNDPKNEKVFEKRLTADDYGGFDGELTLPKEATLGQYYIFLPQDKPDMNPCGGGSSFRLEEYKKPEFEVTVEAPKEPVMLGDKVTATIQAKYLFGAPVKEAKVKYKVTRTSYSNDWCPAAPWDWFYGPGYWWFCYDYDWYPGWREWGCKRPIMVWWNWAPPQQPEIVAEAEAPIGADGTVKVEIDTGVAKAVLGDTDHK